MRNIVIVGGTGFWPEYHFVATPGHGVSYPGRSALCCRLAIMPGQHDKLTIISMAVVASASATLLHEGVGHGVTAWLRGDIPTELTSNHLSSLRPDRWVDAGGTLVNLFVGTSSLLASRVAGDRANVRYFFWIFAALNLLHGTGYFLFSGISGFGDWNEVIRGLPNQGALRIGMTVFGAVMYFFAVWLLAVSVRSFVPDRRTYNIVGRLPYFAAALFSCAAGALDPLGIKLLLVSTIPAAFGGSSGLLWADSLLPRTTAGQTLLVRRQIAWWFAAAIVGGSYIAFIGRGIQFHSESHRPISRLSPMQPVEHTAESSDHRSERGYSLLLCQPQALSLMEGQCA